ncbi:hypothetical protein JCM1406_12510 [Clostridium novyi]
MNLFLLFKGVSISLKTSLDEVNEEFINLFILIILSCLLSLKIMIFQYSNIIHNQYNCYQGRKSNLKEIEYSGYM